MVLMMKELNYPGCTWNPIYSAIIGHIWKCDVVLCSFEDEYKHFGAICCLQLQGRTVKMNVAVTNSC